MAAAAMLMVYTSPDWKALAAATYLAPALSPAHWALLCPAAASPVEAQHALYAALPLVLFEPLDRRSNSHISG